MRHEKHHYKHIEVVGTTINSKGEATAHLHDPSRGRCYWSAYGRNDPEIHPYGFSGAEHMADRIHKDQALSFAKHMAESLGIEVVDLTSETKVVKKTTETISTPDIIWLVPDREDPEIIHWQADQLAEGGVAYIKIKALKAAADKLHQMKDTSSPAQPDKEHCPECNNYIGHCPKCHRNL